MAKKTGGVAAKVKQVNSRALASQLCSPRLFPRSPRLLSDEHGPDELATLGRRVSPRPPRLSPRSPLPPRSLSPKPSQSSESLGRRRRVFPQSPRLSTRSRLSLNAIEPLTRREVARRVFFRRLAAAKALRKPPAVIGRCLDDEARLSSDDEEPARSEVASERNGPDDDDAERSCSGDPAEDADPVVPDEDAAAKRALPEESDELVGPLSGPAPRRREATGLGPAGAPVLDGPAAPREPAPVAVAPHPLTGEERRLRARYVRLYAKRFCQEVETPLSAKMSYMDIWAWFHQAERTTLLLEDELGSPPDCDTVGLVVWALERRLETGLVRSRIPHVLSKRRPTSVASALKGVVEQVAPPKRSLAALCKRLPLAQAEGEEVARYAMRFEANALSLVELVWPAWPEEDQRDWHFACLAAFQAGLRHASLRAAAVAPGRGPSADRTRATGSRCAQRSRSLRGLWTRRCLRLRWRRAPPWQRAPAVAFTRRG